MMIQMRAKDDKCETKMGILEGFIRVYELAFFLYRLEGLFSSKWLELITLEPGSFHVIPHVNRSQPKVNTMHAISAVQCYALR